MVARTFIFVSVLAVPPRQTEMAAPRDGWHPSGFTTIRWNVLCAYPGPLYYLESRAENNSRGKTETKQSTLSVASVLIDVFVGERSKRCGRNWPNDIGAHMDKQLLRLSVLAKRCGHIILTMCYPTSSPLSCFINSPSFPFITLVFPSCPI